jgi:hypothetical protein
MNNFAFLSVASFLPKHLRMARCNAEASRRNLNGNTRKDYMNVFPGKTINLTADEGVRGQATQGKLSFDVCPTYLSTCLKMST